MRRKPGLSLPSAIYQNARRLQSLAFGAEPRLASHRCMALSWKRKGRSPLGPKSLRFLLWCCLGLSVFGCGNRGDSTHGVPRSNSNLPAASQKPSPNLPPPIPLSELGFAAVPRLPNPTALERNNQGFAEYKKGKLENALRSFQDALALAPDFDLARYNSAAMLARLGRHAEVSTILRQLLRRDLPRFGPRFSSDTDLVNFRDTELGHALREEVERLRQTWLTQAKLGLPMLAYVRHPVAIGGTLPEPSHVRPEWFRAGVWLEATQRFLPLFPPTPRPVTALVDPEGGRGLVVDARTNPCLFDFCPRFDDIELYYFDQFLPDALGKPQVSIDSGAQYLFRIGVALGESGPRWLVNDNLDIGWRESVGGESRRAKMVGPAPSSVETIGILGGFSTHLPKGWKRTRSHLVLPDARKLKLSMALAGSKLQVVELPDRKTALLASVHYGCVCGEQENGSILDYSIWTLDRSELKLSPWKKGSGNVTLRLGPDGGLYLQRDNQVTRYQQWPSETSSHPLPSGFLLIPPLVRDENCCGL